MASRRTLAIVAATAVAVSLFGWGFFHPDFRPDASAIAPAIREELAKTGFTSTQGVSVARFETVESMTGFSENWTLRQKIVSLDALLTEKRSRRHAKGSTEQASGLYVGPLTVVRFSRSWPPIIGDLLPYQFWQASRMTGFTVEETTGFPHTKGGRMRARVTYEDRYGDGELALIENRRLRCDVANVVDAASIHAGLSGAAARIECHDEPEPDGRRVGPANTQPYSMGNISYAHWYILNRGWSIPIEGQLAFRFENATETRKWSTKLVSFD